ncbi:MAG TPA: NAD+ synthase [Actinobacteria bacterium]|nr:NAD+ synthase [Actinomycetota bacterium]
MRSLRIGLAQINCTVGDLDGNLEKIKLYCRRGAELKVDLLAFPELAICGYPPEDLVLKPKFISDCQTSLKELSDFSRELEKMTLIVGCIDFDTDIYNGAAVINGGEIRCIYHKVFLPNYGVFDEQRYFKHGDKALVVLIGGVRVGVTICEDIWYSQGPQRVETTVGGAEVVVNINASPYQVDKDKQRERMLATRAKEGLSTLAYVNLIGGQDELVFDGLSMIIDHEGKRVAEAGRFREDLLITDIDADAVSGARDIDKNWASEGNDVESADLLPVRQVILSDQKIEGQKPSWSPRVFTKLGSDEEVLAALRLGLADYVRKNGFAHVVVGLSGGIDSALTAVLAAQTLGADNLTPVFLPSRFTSDDSAKDAAMLAQNLGVELMVISIDDIFKNYLSSLEQAFKDKPQDITEENLQARIRGNILMALSNKFGWLLLSTGNKSEMSVGYATLYGDMSGGFAVLKDVTKTLVIRLARHINIGRVIIPERVITKPPSAELRPDQKDSDSLPEYGVLDQIISAYVEDNKSAREIIESGFETKIVNEVIGMIDKSEYKRRQAPPGVKITGRAFGKDWRLPITNAYRGRLP